MTFIEGGKKPEPGVCEINLNNLKVIQGDKSRNRAGDNEISKSNTTTDNAKSFRNKTEIAGGFKSHIGGGTQGGVKIKEIKDKTKPVTVVKTVVKVPEATKVRTTTVGGGKKFINEKAKSNTKTIKFLLLNGDTKLDFNKSKEGFFDFTNAVKESNKSKSKDKKLITTISSNKLSSTVSNFSNKTLSFNKGGNNNSSKVGF
jgi:hypothetical protein